MSPRVLIVSHLYEPSVDAVIQCLERRRVSWARLNCEQFPLMGRGVLRLSEGDVPHGVIELPNQRLDTREFTAVWFRRVAKSPLPKGLTQKDREFVQNECSTFLSSFLDLVSACWVNDRTAERLANSKVHQLRIARSLGLRCPKTLVSNCPAQIREFVAQIPGEVLFKPIAGYAPRGCDFSRAFASLPEVKDRFDVEVTEDDSAAVEIMFAQILTEERLTMLDSIEFCPATFQEYVDKRVEVRVTIVGDDLFACEIHSQSDPATVVDFRRMALLDPENQPIHRKHQLDVITTEKLKSLMKALGLKFGCVDLILTPDGEYVFLEINPSGQWLWVERLVGFPISEMLAKMLSNAGSEP